jgi:predicted AAA+ superfamily ATPase
MVLRGARQVGKSYLARALASKAFENLMELNFERDPTLASLFTGPSVRETIRLLEARFGQPIREGGTLLFLDEVQAAPEVFAKLRYFHEELPGLHLLAAGSLLDDLLDDHSFSMPVGRIEYLHLGPLVFEEFLEATKRGSLGEWMGGWEWGDPLPEGMLSELHNAFRQYLIVGGMPEAVAAFSRNGSYLDCARIQESILATYRDDFQKYSRRVQTPRMDKVFARVPAMIGRKFKYSEVDSGERSKDLGAALRLLCLGRVVHKVRQTHGNGLPLGAEADERNFKVFFLDVGLVCRALGLQADELENIDDHFLVQRGGLCEQAVAQNLLHSGPGYEFPELFYWARDNPNSTAEIDFLIQLGGEILPVEVKAGKTGRLRSLHQFGAEKNPRAALRFNAAAPSLSPLGSTEDGSPRTLLASLPLSFLNQAARLLKSSRKNPLENTPP